MGERRSATRDRAPARERDEAAPTAPARQLPLLPETGERTDRRLDGIAPGWRAGRVPANGRAPARPDPLAARIGEAIAVRRQRLGMNQTELARALGCDRSAVCRWEMGLRLPSIPHLVALGRALGCGARALLPE